MKNVLLIGDSIRRGYDKAAKKTLEGKANVYFPEKTVDLLHMSYAIFTNINLW